MCRNNSGIGFFENIKTERGTNPCTMLSHYLDIRQCWRLLNLDMILDFQRWQLFPSLLIPWLANSGGR